MKIIKKGEIPEEKPVREECIRCKTIFEYTWKDDVDFDRDGSFVKCPVCGAYITAKRQYP